MLKKDGGYDENQEANKRSCLNTRLIILFQFNYLLYLLLLKTFRAKYSCTQTAGENHHFTSKITFFISNWDFSQDILHNTRGFQQDLKFKEKLQIVEFHSFR